MEKSSRLLYEESKTNTGTKDDPNRQTNKTIHIRKTFEVPGSPKHDKRIRQKSDGDNQIRIRRTEKTKNRILQ